MPFRTFFSFLLTFTTSGIFLLSEPLRAEKHVVSSSELHKQLEMAAQFRQSNLEKVQRFFAADSVKKVLKGSQVNYTKLTKGLPLLSDEELALLAHQTGKYEANVAAGDLSNEQITYILIALGTAVIVLIAVH